MNSNMENLLDCFHRTTQEDRGNEKSAYRGGMDQNGDGDGGHRGANHLVTVPMNFQMPPIDFPRFNGDGVHGWINKCGRYFRLISVPEELRVVLASMHLDKGADHWFQSQYKTLDGLYWPDFVVDVCNRFPEFGIEDVLGRFRKLEQTGSVEDYLTQFEKLKPLVSARIGGLAEQFFVSSFVSGLRDEIQHKVLMFGPTTIAEAFRLARLQEGHLAALGRVNFSNSVPRNAVVPGKNEGDKGYTCVKKVTHDEMQARRDRNLCYYCDEVYHRRHVCKTKQIFMVVSED